MGRVAGNRQQIDAEAADWLAAIECGTADRDSFELWRSKDSANALAFLRISQISRELNALRESGMSGRLPIVTEGAIQPRIDRRRLLMLGAAGAVAAGLGGLGWSVAAAAHDAETGVGERHRIVVANGLVLELNTDSHVEWRQRDHAYDIRLLRGEVMLERQAGAAGCRLHCGESQVDLAPGARMDARLGPKDVGLSMLAGEASLRTSGTSGAIRLLPLRKAMITDGGHPSLAELSPVEAGAVSAWQQGEVYFDGQNLAAAVAEYNRYLTRPIEIADPSIRQLSLGGRFSATDPTEFCKALKDIYGVSAQTEPDRIRLTWN